jgi:hypothetical protein
MFDNNTDSLKVISGSVTIDFIPFVKASQFSKTYYNVIPNSIIFTTIFLEFRTEDIDSHNNTQKTGLIRFPLKHIIFFEKEENFNLDQPDLPSWTRLKFCVQPNLGILHDE